MHWYNVRVLHIKEKTDDGATPLHLACLQGHIEVVKVLLNGDGIAINQGTKVMAQHHSIWHVKQIILK